MARRMSNRDRIGRLREEADATAREKEQKRTERAARPPAAGRTRSAKAPEEPVRMKLVWAVKDAGGNVVTTYPYPQKDTAQAEAQRLHAADGRTYIVTPAKVPFDL